MVAPGCAVTQTRDQWLFCDLSKLRQLLPAVCTSSKAGKACWQFTNGYAAVFCELFCMARVTHTS